MVDGALGTLDLTLSKRDMIGFATRVFRPLVSRKKSIFYAAEIFEKNKHDLVWCLYWFIVDFNKK